MADMKTIPMHGGKAYAEVGERVSIQRKVW